MVGTFRAPVRAADSLRFLRAVLIVKIAGTVAFFALPLLALRSDTLGTLLGSEMGWLAAKLLGWSYAAILFGYVGGLHEARRGVFPTATVLMGLVSNGGAALFLTYHLLDGQYCLPPVGAVGGVVFTLVIATALAGCWMRHLLVRGGPH